MTSPKIDTFRRINPMVYSWRTPDVPKYDGWEKVGYTKVQSVEDRVAQQASQLNVKKDIVWARRALFTSGEGGTFTDREFHTYLKQQGVEREYDPTARPQLTEWHNFAPAPHSSLEYFNAFAGHDYTDFQTSGEDVYALRPEQDAAVAQAMAAFAAGSVEVLWNAKPRFGKTLTTYHLMREMDVRKVLIVTNRPAIANSWFDDFTQFIGHQTTFKFVSESSSLSERPTMTREQWRGYVSAHVDQDPRIVEFVSLQDLKGSRYFGGVHNKLRHVADFEWDLLVIDEAHEGVDTTKTDVAFDKISRKHTLHLSGTPFKALASGRFASSDIFNWTYEDEQTANAQWDDDTQENPYAVLPTLNLLTYQLSRMIAERLSVGVAASADEDAENIDYTFSLNEFFATNERGFFEHEAEVIKFLDRLTTNEKYPFSTPELRDEVRHSFWLLNRVASAKALEKLLKAHPVFKDYAIVLAAGDGKSADDDSDLVAVGKSLDKVRSAIAQAEATDGRTITLSVGQLTTGVTVPEWTAVVMLSDLNSPALYMQAAFRAQNPHLFERDGQVFQKQNAYIFDFAPERTLRIFDEFANNLRSSTSNDYEVRKDNVRRLLNFFPVIGEDSEGRMIELDAEKVLTFPQVFKAREVVRRGFLSNLLFDNVHGIFRYSEHVKEILEKLPTAKESSGKTKKGTIDLPVPPPVTDDHGNVQVDRETVINPKVAELGPPVWSIEEAPTIGPDTPPAQVARDLASFVTAKLESHRDKLKDDYGMTKAQVDRDIKATEAEVKARIQRAFIDHDIANSHLDDDLAAAATQAEADAVEARRAEEKAALREEVFAIVGTTLDATPAKIIEREVTKTEQKRATAAMDKARDHLRGFARTIPMFLMAYGDREMTLANFDDYTPDDVFETVTGITEAEFRTLRDGQQIEDEEGNITTIPGLFDAPVFDAAVQEFLDKKEALADYFDPAQTEDIFAYIPQQKTSMVFTPQNVVKHMVDILEAENPGIFKDPDTTFADPVSTAGLFLMELVRRLDHGLTDQIPDQEARLQHILTKQIFKISQSEITHRVTVEAVSGGHAQRRQWIDHSNHFRVANIAKLATDERQHLAAAMLTGGNAMTRKFDVVIGNPPYQEEATGDGTRDTPVYHLFMDAAYEIGTKVVLITPARFLFNAGFTPKAWNIKMLADEHLSVAHYEADSKKLFPGLSDPIKGGIAITYRDSANTIGPIRSFAKHPELSTILSKVDGIGGPALESAGITSSRSYRFTNKLYDDHPHARALRPEGNAALVNTNTFEQFSFLYAEDHPEGDVPYIQLLGVIKNRRNYRWIRSEYITGPGSLDRYKVAVPAANGSGSTTDFFGVALNRPTVLGPGVGVTQTFITIGSFDTEAEAQACLKYISTKFARAMLGVLKATQHNPAATWKHVPNQDFTDASDIDWSRSIPEIDAELYAKYGLDADEIAFIEEKVTPMA